MSLKPKSSDHSPVLETNCKHIIEFLIKNHYTQAISLYILQQPDLQLFWVIASFIFKKLDPTLSVSNLKELNDILKSLNSPYQTIKASADEKSWTKLIKILSWASKVISVPSINKQSHYSALFYSAYQLKLKGESYEPLITDYISKVPEYIEEDKSAVSRLSNEIETLNLKKKALQSFVIDDRLTAANEEMNEEVEKLAERETDFKILYNYNQTLWQTIRKKLGGRPLNNELVNCLKTEQQEIHSSCIQKISEIVELDSIIQVLTEKVSRIEGSEIKEKQIFDYQEKIENMRNENGRVLMEIKNFNEKISESNLDISGMKAKWKKEENHIQDVIIDDRESISKHARVIAGLLESVELNNY